jgi:hypothetical protein
MNYSKTTINYSNEGNIVDMPIEINPMDILKMHSDAKEFVCKSVCDRRAIVKVTCDAYNDNDNNKLEPVHGKFFT